MERKNYYIGSLELQICSEMPFSLHPGDEKFLNSVLPVAHRTEIEIRLTEDHPAVSGIEYRTSNMAIFYTDQEERRVYNISGKESVHDNDTDIFSRRSYMYPERVQLLIRKNRWGKYSNGFRFWYYIHLEELLLENQALLLHSASIIYRGEAILFTAPSGTGKSTQTDLWHQYAEGVEDLNGDRTLLQKTENGWFACGFPICGSSGRCEQKAVSPRTLVIVRQGSEDEIKELTPAQKAMLLYSEVTIPNTGKKYPETAITLIEDLIRSVPAVMFTCTMRENAVMTLQTYLYRQET